MEPSVVHSQVEDFDAEDAFAYFVLGLISLSRRFIERLEAEVKTTRPNVPSASTEETVAHILV